MASAVASEGTSTKTTKKSSRSWHWSCSSKYCKSSWKGGDQYYTLTKLASARKQIVDAYLSVLGKAKHEVNFKRHVICTKHWPSGSRKDIEDLPTIKFTTLESPSNSNKVEHWNCAAALCTNSWRTNGKLTYYRLSEVANCPEKRHAYNKILKNKGVDFKRDFICSAHWSKGTRMDINDLPDLPCSNSYLEKKITKVTPRRNIESAKRALTKQSNEKVKRRKLIYKKDDNASECEVLRKEIEDLKEKLKTKTEQVNEMFDEINSLKAEKEAYAKQLKQFAQSKQKSTFSYASLKLYPQQFLYMTGLSLNDFDCFFEFIQPYICAIIYPDCKSYESGQRKLTKRTELMCFLTIWRHTLHLGIMGFMTNTSDSTQSRIFSAWAVFLATVFEAIDLRPFPGEVSSLLPRDFWASGFQDTVLLGDCTENWISSSENYDISSVTFSSYKNHDTGKTGIWITPYGSLVMCTDTYPGSITDNDLTSECGVLDMIKEKGTTVLTDKGFGIEDLCHSKGLLHNRPPLKFDAQYEESDISKNFDVATLRIYNENYIGRMKDWSILSACWPKSRCDILGCVYKVFAHIVNMLFDPISPKEAAQQVGLH